LALFSFHARHLTLKIPSEGWHFSCTLFYTLETPVD
jgi:hypothetical protein